MNMTSGGNTVSVRSLRLRTAAIKEFHRSEKCLKAAKFADAAEHLKKALMANPDFVEAHNNLGASFIELQRYDDAIAEFEAAIAIDPKFEAPFRNKSLSLYLSNRFVESEAAARQALIRNPERRETRFLLGSTLAAEGSTSVEAEGLLRESLFEFPEARLSLAQLLFSRCANVDATTEIRRYIDSENVDLEKRQTVQRWLDLHPKGQASKGCAPQRLGLQ